MKKILFMINDLSIGGSEKSLVALLNSIDYSKYSVDLLVLKKGGKFEEFLPNEVKKLDVPEYYKYLNKDNLNISLLKKTKYTICRLKSSINLRINNLKSKKINNQQIFYKEQKNILEMLEKNYDVAIAYAQGFPTYFISEKVKANKKIAWINCDYSYTLYDKKFDENYYENINNIIAVSESGKKSILRVNNKYSDKVKVIKDIINPKLIKKMASENEASFDKETVNILTVARLVLNYKGYDLAIKTAKLLKDKGYKFKWYVVGDGVNKEDILKLIEVNDIKKEFILLGSKSNPYPYMKNCDIYVQPSRIEGFGLTVMEAKILKKPIVCTNFSTAKEIINHNEDGLIVGMNENLIFNGIRKYIDDNIFKQSIITKLCKEEEYDSTSEIEKIYKLIGDI